MKDYPIVVILAYYRNLDNWLYKYKEKHPDCIITKISKRPPYEVVIDNKTYMFVSYDTTLKHLKGRTYYDIDGNLYHSGYLMKERKEDED